MCIRDSPPRRRRGADVRGPRTDARGHSAGRLHHPRAGEGLPRDHPPEAPPDAGLAGALRRNARLGHAEPVVGGRAGEGPGGQGQSPAEARQAEERPEAEA
eukprot:13966241-Alexandrium_andersonii.AAC.1